VKTLVLKQCYCEEDIEKLVPKIGSFEEDSKNLDPELDSCKDDSKTTGYKPRLSRQEDKEHTVSTKGEKYTDHKRNCWFGTWSQLLCVYNIVYVVVPKLEPFL